MKHRPTVEPGQQPESPEKRDTIRELGELEAELRRAGSHRQAKTVANAIKLLRRVPMPGLTQAFVTKATTSDDDDPSTIP